MYCAAMFVALLIVSVVGCVLCAIADRSAPIGTPCRDERPPTRRGPAQVVPAQRTR